MQERRNSSELAMEVRLFCTTPIIANAMELLQSCAKPLKCPLTYEYDGQHMPGTQEAWEGVHDAI